MTQSKPKDICQVRCFNEELVTQANEALPGEDLLAEIQVLFSALADRSRLKILYTLSEGTELCVCDVASLLGMKIATASHHLRKLRDLQILKYRNDGKLAYYSLKDQRVAEILHYTLNQLVE
ncbi:metalloregulator ArsR/SmtB family transcription factor [Acaryochloris sp. CCMEE 5410]|uniref:ArsR/SmtB family transcription factor n=1 Tax=Acaryochloris sp. CCMEE 5410 TaxID=310037 RepID=UPI0002483D8B|nr:metalloregulator ArsR/SmtB family transcription factor [Acaryochloris sp. CCMEE 5410]KAI9134754.1 helix-turn-helix transcriptional regulator [Acaryochloris sp. CCMEE 5410]